MNLFNFLTLFLGKRRFFKEMLEPVSNPRPAATESDLALEREKAYTDMVAAYVKHYITKSKSNQTMKKWFFALVFFMLFALIAGVCVCMIFLFSCTEDSTTKLAGIISSVVGIVSSIVVLPTIMATYLFPKNEDEYIRDMIIHMRESDSKDRREENTDKKEDKDTGDTDSGKDAA